jgi:septum formation protein
MPGALVIGSDQVATLDGEQIGKPGNHANALAQLQKMRGRRVIFHTALCLWDGRDGTCQVEEHPDLRQVPRPARCRTGRLPAHRAAVRLRRQRQERRLGIAILERIDSSDPTALTGLPLIALTGMLRKTGISFFNI